MCQGVKHRLLALWALLGLTGWGEELRIRWSAARSTLVIRDQVWYAPLSTLAEECGVQIRPAGQGFQVANPARTLELPSGQLQVNDTQLDMLEEDGQWWVSAEAFCLALGGKVTRPDHGVLNLIPPSPFLPARVQRSDPASFFLSQVRSSTNPNGSRDNGNCGPACLAMAARAFGRWPLHLADSDVPGMLSWVRREMGHSSDESQGTNIPWLTKPAQKLQLHPQLFQDFEQLLHHLAQGRMVIVAGPLSQLNFPGGTHALLVVGSSGDDLLVNDPGLFFKRPGSRIPADQLRGFFLLGIAVGEN